MNTYIISKTNKISFNTHLLVIAHSVHIYSVNIVISSLFHHVRPDDGLIGKRAKICCLSFESLQLSKSSVVF